MAHDLTKPVATILFEAGRDTAIVDPVSNQVVTFFDENHKVQVFDNLNVGDLELFLPYATYEKQGANTIDLLNGVITTDETYNMFVTASRPDLADGLLEAWIENTKRSGRVLVVSENQIAQAQVESEDGTTDPVYVAAATLDIMSSGTHPVMAYPYSLDIAIKDSPDFTIADFSDEHMERYSDRNVVPDYGAKTEQYIGILTDKPNVDNIAVSVRGFHDRGIEFINQFSRWEKRTPPDQMDAPHMNLFVSDILLSNDWSGQTLIAR